MVYSLLHDVNFKHALITECDRKSAGHPIIYVMFPSHYVINSTINYFITCYHPVYCVAV